MFSAWGGSSLIARASGTHRPLGPLLAGRYQVRETIRSGKVFTLHAAYDLLRKEHVQVWVSSHGLGREFPQAVARLREQAEGNSRNRHPLFLNVLFVGEEKHRLFFVEERPRGESLQATLRKRRERQELFSFREAFGMGWLLCRGLEQLHGTSVHGFMNPEDVYLEHWPGGPISFYPRIARTGLRDVLRSVGMAFDGLSDEAACYAAPEFLSDTRLRVEVDIYGIGALLYSLFTLRPPTGCFVRPSRIGPGLPGDLDLVLLQAMDEDPGERYGSAGALGQALHGLEGETLKVEELERAEERLLKPERMGSQTGDARPAGAVGRSPRTEFAGATSAAAPIHGKLQRLMPSGSLLSRVLLLALSLTLLLLAAGDAPSRLRKGGAARPEDIQRWDRLFRAQEVSQGRAGERAESSQTVIDPAPLTESGEGF